jgi:hypothetical protein
VLASQRSGEIAGNEAVDKLNLPHMRRVEHVFEYGPLDHQIVEILLEQLLSGNAGDERSFRVFLIPNRLSCSCSLILRNLYQEKRDAEIERHASSDV